MGIIHVRMIFGCPNYLSYELFLCPLPKSPRKKLKQKQKLGEVLLYKNLTLIIDIILGKRLPTIPIGIIQLNI